MALLKIKRDFFNSKILRILSEKSSNRKATAGDTLSEKEKMRFHKVFEP